MRKVTHEKDIEYFNEFEAPLMELMHSAHFTNINSTISFFGPMLYFLVRQLGCEQILEIGHAEGYTSWYLANAIRDNAERFQMWGNRYYGIDIIQTEKVAEQFAKQERLKDFVKIQNLDSMKLTPETFKDVRFDMIFQDGNHDTEHVLYEMKTLYPQLKGEGHGFWVFHDCYGPAEEGFRELEKLIKQGVYNFEYIRFPDNYGMSILRKMEGYDPEKRHWWDSK